MPRVRVPLAEGFEEIEAVTLHLVSELRSPALAEKLRASMLAPAAV